MKWDQNQISEQHGKRVLITGANSGIGLAVGEVFAAKVPKNSSVNNFWKKRNICC